MLLEDINFLMKLLARPYHGGKQQKPILSGFRPVNGLISTSLTNSFQGISFYIFRTSPSDTHLGEVSVSVTLQTAEEEKIERFLLHLPKFKSMEQISPRNGNLITFKTFNRLT